MKNQLNKVGPVISRRMNNLPEVLKPLVLGRV